MISSILKSTLGSLYKHSFSDIQNEVITVEKTQAVIDMETSVLPLQPQFYEPPAPVISSLPPSVSISPFANNSSTVNPQFLTQERLVDLHIPRYPKRRNIEAPIDIYTSVNIPQIITLIGRNTEDEDFQNSISFKGPLPLGDMLREVHHTHHTNPLQLAGETNSIRDTHTGRIILQKVDCGWSDPQTLTQIYDNKGNRATDPDADFQICQVRRVGKPKMYEVHFTDWTHLTPMEMSWEQLTRNGSNKIMIDFLSHLEYVAVKKWQSLGGKKAKRRMAIPQSEVQDFVKQLSIAREQIVNDSLSKFIAYEDPLMITTDGHGCLVACVINALRLDSWEHLNDGLNCVLSLEMLATFCCDKPVGPICAIQKCTDGIAVDYLLTIYAEVCASEWNRELELYILYDPKGSCHGVSIDLRRKLIYDSASDFKKPYYFNEEVMGLLGFERFNANLELRRITNINKRYKKNISNGRFHDRRHGPKL